MAITSELLGRLGGKVERTPVSIPNVGEPTVLMSFSFPAGQTFLVGAIGTSSKSPSISSMHPRIRVTGSEEVRAASPKNPWGATGVVSGDAEITFYPQGSGNLVANFDGEIFWARVN